MKQTRGQQLKQWHWFGFCSWVLFVPMFCWACSCLCSCRECVRGYCAVNLGPLCQKVWAATLCSFFFLSVCTFCLHTPEFRQFLLLGSAFPNVLVQSRSFAKEWPSVSEFQYKQILTLLMLTPGLSRPPSFFCSGKKNTKSTNWIELCTSKFQ